MEFRLVELQANTIGAVRGFHSIVLSRNDSDDSLDESSNIVPKEEGSYTTHHYK